MPWFKCNNTCHENFGCQHFGHKIVGRKKIKNIGG